MKYATITTAYGCGLEPGDILNVSGRLAKVVSGSGTTITVKYLNWLERLWFWLAHLMRLRGFWARVWRR
jgi:hypothetical protein